MDPKLAGVLLLGITLAVFQQWCGINVIFNYAADVFAAAGYNVSDILLNIVITGAVNLVFTFVAIAMVDGAGRRKLMLFGSAALALIYTVLGIGFHMHGQGLYMLLLVVAAIACYAMSLAPVTWVVISEIFPNRIRGAAMSAGDHLFVDRKLCSYLHISSVESRFGACAHFLDLRRHLSRRFFLYSLAPS